MSQKPILLIDFDGVLHSYTSGWQGPRVVADPPVHGAMPALLGYMLHFQVMIYSSRSRQWGGRRAMKRWIRTALIEWADRRQPGEIPFFEPGMDPWDEELEWWARSIIKRLGWPIWKPAAFFTIDDRCARFEGPGSWPDARALLAFKPWNKQGV